jgi:hypothetical protein
VARTQRSRVAYNRRSDSDAPTPTVTTERVVPIRDRPDEPHAGRHRLAPDRGRSHLAHETYGWRIIGTGRLGTAFRTVCP